MNTKNNSPTSFLDKTRKTLLLTMPLWVPFVYVGLWWLEVKFTNSTSPVLGSEFGNIIFFLVPGIWSVAMLMDTRTPIIGAVLIFPFLYVFGIFVIGVLGWATCGELHLCR